LYFIFFMVAFLGFLPGPKTLKPVPTHTSDDSHTARAGSASQQSQPRAQEGKKKKTR
jgi:hypothetical protein